MAGIEITGDDHRQSRREPFHIGHDHAGAPGLDRWCKIKVGGCGQQGPALFFKPSHHTLSGPPGPGHFGRDIGKTADEMVTVSQTGPVFVKKDQVGLPPGQVPVVPADMVISFEYLFQKIGLKMVHLLESDEIHVPLFQKFPYHRLTPFPAVFTIFGQAEPQVHGHYAEGCRVCFHFITRRDVLIFGKGM